MRLYVALERRFGGVGAPMLVGTAYEVAVRAVLTRHTTWTNAAHAEAALRARRLLRPDRLAALPDAELAAIIRVAGAPRIKARRLQAFTRWLIERFGGRFDGVRRAPLSTLRRQMLTIPGLGPETVDAILLFAAGRPVFVADASARTFLARHGFVPDAAGYEETRRFVEAHLPSDPALLGEFHALLGAVAAVHRRTLTASPAAGPRSAPPRRGGRPRAPARPSP